jgi:hypothetical protein
LGHKIEIFSAGCGICEKTIDAVRKMVGIDDEVHVHDMHREATANRAAQLGIRSLPAVIIDGKLTGCCGEGLFGAGDPPVWEFTSSAQSEALVPAGSEMYTGLVELTFAAENEKATLVERLHKASCKLNNLISIKTLTSP